MEYKYKDNIAFAIAKTLYDKPKREMYYRKIKFGVEKLLGHLLSDRQLVKQLLIMVNEKSLNRIDPTGKRGSKVYYSLTEEGRSKFDLKIIGPTIEVERRRGLYGLLIFFEVYKRVPLLTERRLSKFLELIGSSLSEFERPQKLERPHHIPGMLYKSIKGVEIVGLPLYDPNTKPCKMLYYTVIPGFSIKEFIAYQRACF